jgi:hypothetical protein
MCFGLSNEALMLIFWYFGPLLPTFRQNFIQISSHTVLSLTLCKGKLENIFGISTKIL